MKMQIPTIASLLLLLASDSSLAADPLREQAKGLFEPIPSTAPALPETRRRPRN